MHRKTKRAGSSDSPDPDTLRGFDPVGLRCEYAENPLGIAVRHPRLSWKAQHPRRNRHQSAYQILAATDLSLLDSHTPDAWDSGVVPNAQSIGIYYGGSALLSGQRIFWKVRLCDDCGNWSTWSDPAWFETALLDPEEWQGEWIGCLAPCRGVSPLFRREFSLAAKVTWARACICGLGYYELRINGRKVGDHVLDPGWTDYTKRVLYAVYDITGLLQSGPNALGVNLGEGWYGNDRLVESFPKRNPHWLGSPRFILQVSIECDDGTKTSICSSRQDWMTAPGPIIQNSIYDGETYDARLEQPGWDMPGFQPDPARGWRGVVAVEAPGGALQPQTMEPIKVTADHVPISVSNPTPGIYVFDTGQNLAGWARICVRGERGAVVKLRFSEVLGTDGLVNQENLRTAQATDTYICAGRGEEIWEPRFTYHGFRYVQVEGYPGVPTQSSVTVRQVRSAVAQTSRFECDNELLNAIQQAVVWTEESNLHSVPTDCPQRDERMGWLNDAVVRMEETLYNFDAARIVAKWEDDIADTQDEAGMIRDTAPFCFSLNPAEAVNSSYLLIPWLLYVHLGDLEILKRHYEGMRRWTEFLCSRAEGEIIPFSHYGDWASPVAYCESPESPKSGITPGTLISTGFHYYNHCIMAEIARALGLAEDVRFFTQAADRISPAFNRAFFDPALPRYAGGSQASNAFPLYLGLAPQETKKKLIQAIIDDIADHDYHLTTGNLCTRYVLEELSCNGRIDIAFRLATRTTYPSWGYMLENGATTIWERWEMATGGGMNSHNHPMYGTVSLWMLRYLGGISPDPDSPGYGRINFRPCLPEGLSYVRCALETIRGRVGCSWRRTGEETSIEVIVPYNSTAVVRIPEIFPSMIIREGADVVWHDGAAVTGHRELTPGVCRDGAVCFETGSGVWHFSLAPG